MEILRYHSSKETLVSQLFLVKIVDQKKDLYHILFNNFCLKCWHLGAHLGLKKLHQDCQEILMFFAVNSKLCHYFASKDYCTLAKPILNISIDLEFIRSILWVESIVTQINQASDLELSKEMIDRLISLIWDHTLFSLLSESKGLFSYVCPSSLPRTLTACWRIINGSRYLPLRKRAWGSVICLPHARVLFKLEIGVHDKILPLVDLLFDMLNTRTTA